MGQILVIIGSLLTILIGIGRHFSRKNAEKRKQAEQARKDLDAAKKDSDTSGITSAVDRINRL